MPVLAALLLSLTGTDRLGDPTPPGVTVRYGTTRMCVGNGKGEVRFHPTREETALVTKRQSPGVLPSPRGWQRDAVEEDADPNPLTTTSADGRREFAIRFRIDDKADRYRGYPECFVRVYDRAANRVEARYAFRLDDIGTCKRLEPLDGGRQVFQGFTPSDDGRFLAWIDHEARLRIRHLPTGRVVTVPARFYSERPMAFSPRGNQLTVLDNRSILEQIDPFTGQLQASDDSPATAPVHAAISPDGKRVATGHDSGAVWVWDAATGKPLWHTEPTLFDVRDLHFNPTGTTVSATHFGERFGIRTFDAKTGKERGPVLPCKYYRTQAVSADGERIADLDSESDRRGSPVCVRTREVATGKVVGRVRLDGAPEPKDCYHAVISRNGRVIAVIDIDGDTFVYDAATGKRLLRLPIRVSRSFAVSDDGRVVLRSYSDQDDQSEILDVFDLTAAGRESLAREVKTQGTGYWLMATSPDGRYATRRVTSEVGIFDLRTGQTVKRDCGPVTTFFPDGKSVLTLPGIRGAERVSLEPLAWKFSPPPKPTDARLNQLWVKLGEPAALDAVFELARHSAEAVPFLKSKLLVAPPDPKAVAAHIGRLASREYAEREESTKALRAFGPAVLPALRAELKVSPSPEAKNRLRKLVTEHADPATPFTLTRLRAVEALERCDTPASRAVLKTLAETANGTPWGDDAAHSLRRLMNR